MFATILEAINRLNGAMHLLQDLLEEEFSLLKERQTEEIMSLEFSMHELLRQIATEKESIKRILGGGRVKDYAAMLADEQKNILLDLLQEIDDSEQNCAKQSTRNTQLSLGLLDQSKEMLDFLHRRIVPPQKNTYGKRGMYTEHKPAPSMIAGRF